MMLTDKENVEPEFLQWWAEKDFSGYPWTRREVQLIALLAWRDGSHDLRKLCGRAAQMLETFGCKGPAVEELRKVAGKEAYD